MSKKGGYTLIDFGDINLTAGSETPANIPGVYERLVFNRRKLVRVTGLSVGGVRFPDTDAMVDIVVGGYNLYTPLYRINVTANGVKVTQSDTQLPIATSSTLGGVKIGAGINVTADGTISATAGGALYRHSITFVGDEYGDDTYHLYSLSTNATPVTDEAGVHAIARSGDVVYARANGGNDYIGVVSSVSSNSISFHLLGATGYLPYSASLALQVSDTVTQIQ